VLDTRVAKEQIQNSMNKNWEKVYVYVKMYMYVYVYMHVYLDSI
jgi:hypothetical protein